MIAQSAAIVFAQLAVTTVTRTCSDGQLRHFIQCSGRLVDCNVHGEMIYVYAGTSCSPRAKLLKS